MLQGRDAILDYYRGLRANGSDYVGYSEPSLKRAVLDTVLPLPAEHVVEIGCGPNPVVPFAIAESGRDVTLVELSTDFAETAKLNASRRGVDVTVVSAPAHETTLPSEAFDLAILTEVLEHVPDELEGATIREMHRILRPDGRLFISVPNESGLLARYTRWRSGQRPVNEEHLREYTHERLRALLERHDFDIERAIVVRGTVEPPWRARSAWCIDRVARRPEWSLKVSFLARSQPRAMTRGSTAYSRE